MLNVIMLNVIMLNVIMPRVIVAKHSRDQKRFFKKKNLNNSKNVFRHRKFGLSPGVSVIKHYARRLFHYKVS
jgi:hypothetical protein